MNVRILEKDDYKKMKELFLDVFLNEPWFDQWNEEQLDLYMKDLTDNNNSLSLALYNDNDEIVGCSLGYVFNWWEGKEYYIKEFFIARNYQNKGIGSRFISLMDEFLNKNEFQFITLMTDLDVPAYNFYKKNGFKHLNDSAYFVKRVTK